MLDTIGKRIDAVITNGPLTQSAIADKCEVSKQAITTWIQKSQIGKKSLLCFCRTTGASYEWILTGEGNMFAGDNEIKESSSADYAPRINKKILANAITLVESIIEKRGFKIPENEKAVAIARIYEETVAGEKITHKEVERLVTTVKELT